MKNALAILFLVAASGCAHQTPEGKTTADFSPGRSLARLQPKGMKELSGMAASHKHPGLLYTHNDSGNGAKVFLMDTLLNIRTTYTLKGITNRDWEDIAVGPGPDPSKTYVYVGDIGDNDAQYEKKYIYRFEEPALDTVTRKADINTFDVITVSLPDGPKDTEALMVHPKTKNIYLISKREKPVFIYEVKFPQATTGTLTATKLASLPMTQITAADFSADGTALLVKNYDNIFYWTNPRAKSIADLVAPTPMIVPYDPEPQGEALTWALDDAGFYTISEKVAGKDSYLFFYKKK